MTSITEIEGKVISHKDKAERYLTEEDILNDVLDGINKITKLITKLNNSYSSIFKHLDDLSRCEVTEEKEIDSIKEILNQLSLFGTKSSINFSRLSKNTILASGCKTVLNNLRNNIRTLREYIEDIETHFFLEEKDELDFLISDLI